MPEIRQESGDCDHFLKYSTLQTLQSGTKEKTATTDGHNYNKYNKYDRTSPLSHLSIPAKRGSGVSQRGKNVHFT